MPTLQAEQMADLLITTQKKLGRFKFSDAATSLQRYSAFTQIMRKNRAQKYSDGTSINWQIGVARSNPARMTGFYAKDIINQGDNLKTANVPWRHVTHNYAYDEIELAINAGESRILDIMKSRRYYAWVEVAEKLETQLWSLPASTTDDIYGIPYHIVKNATAGFNGGNPSGFSDWAGLSRSTYTGLKNYTAPFSAITKDDFVDALSDAMDQTYFMPPLEYPAYSTQRDYGLYTTRVNRRKLKRIIETQNDNLGFDLDPYTDKITFRRTPVEWVPKLDNDTDTPFYGINWATLHPAILTSWFMKEKGPKEVSLQHTTFVYYIDLVMNLECWNPRENFVLSNGTSGSV